MVNKVVLPGNLLSAQQLMLEKGVAFASWRMPFNDVTHTIISENPCPEFDSAEELQHAGPGFIMAPFFPEEKILFIPSSIELKGNIFAPVQFSFQRSEDNCAEVMMQEDTEQEYTMRLSDVIGRIRNHEANKVVISRVIEQAAIPKQELPLLFNELCKTHPGAFVYLVSIPGKALWMGATPELLLESDGKRISTVALAGTRKRDSSGEWGKKEIEEQRWVSRYIRNCLQTAGCLNIEESETQTVTSGNVEHLKTSFQAETTGQSFIPLLSALHPTPAVCGWPAQAAMEIIRQTEPYPRGFYTGFLGPFSANGASALFVNLRCLQLLNNKTLIYAGGGITADSDAASEWTETVMKSRNMLSAIEKIRNLATQSESVFHEK
jgi:isochorismate synthase